MRLLVVGAGSTGGYFGGRLAQAGRDAAAYASLAIYQNRLLGSPA